MSETSYHFDVTADNFDQSVLNNSRHVPVLIDFWAPWCGPCQSLMPLLSRLAEEFKGQFLLAKISIDEQPELATRFGVRSVPTVKLVRSGEVIDEFTGAIPEQQIRQFLDPHIERESDRQLPVIQADFQDGKQEEALTQLQELREQEPDNSRLLLAQLDMLIEANHLQEADTIIQSLPANIEQEQEIQALKSRLQLKASIQDAPSIEILRQQIDSDPNNDEARYQLGHQLAASGDYEAALEAFLNLLQRDRQFADDGARKGMLMIFELLGGEGDLVNRYRRRMAMTMH